MSSKNARRTTPIFFCQLWFGAKHVFNICGKFIEREISKIYIKREGKENLQGSQQARKGREAKLMIIQDQLLWLGPGGGRPI